VSRCLVFAPGGAAAAPSGFPLIPVVKDLSSMSRIRIAPALAGLALGVVLALPGCRKVPPPVADAEGTVLLDGKPLPQAHVEFVPELSNFGAEMISTAVTDDQGHFHLTCTYKDQPGAVVGKHHVIVMEPPTPEEFRSQDPQVQAKRDQYQAKLKNRPIPTDYGTLSTTPLVVEVKADQKSYELRLTRTGHEAARP
jgi:hypothetical protein